MSAFRGLLWKDFKTSKIWFYGWIAIILFIYVLGLILGRVTGEPTVVVVFVIMLGIFHLAAMPVIIFSMLRVEGKTQLWLHSPQSGFKLIAPKLIIAFIYSTLSFLLVDILGVIGLSSLPDDANFFAYWPIKEGIIFNLGITAAAINFSIWVFFFWTFYHALGKFPAIKNIRWLFILGFIIIYQSITAMMMSFGWVQDLFDAWTIDVPAGFAFTVGQGNADAGFYSEIIPFPILPFAFEGLVMITLFITSCWLLDRKVEV
ncbi:hypothetical protein AAEO50_16880 [Rossellomorea oryzaecorticis]|uniref:Uncharacterized protein n=1 Tax=Rossellomorea oryzaecorticis TaxID=1396505 RepID=A0ABU9KCX2_9BACI